MERGHYGPLSHARFCVLAALSEDWEEAHAHAKRAHEFGAFFTPLLRIHLHHGVEVLLRGGEEGLARKEVRRFAERTETNGIGCLTSASLRSSTSGKVTRKVR